MMPSFEISPFSLSTDLSGSKNLLLAKSEMITSAEIRQKALVSLAEKVYYQ
jgi:hypothetical protein